jgi:hypothetical protein
VNILPACAVDEKGVITNFPCKKDGVPTIDDDAEDEFATARSQIQTIIDEGTTFQLACQRLYTDLHCYKEEDGDEEYGWTDAAGKHTVKVEMPATFKMPEVYTEDKDKGFGTWTQCWHLNNYEDQNGSKTWVKVTKTDDGTEGDVRKAGILGFWKTPKTIIRKSKAKWDYKKIGIADIKD